MKPYENLSLEDMPGEIWQDIPGYRGHYLVSNLGRVKSVRRIEHVKSYLHIKKPRYRRECILKQHPCGPKTIYRCVPLCLDGIFRKAQVHRLVAISFIPNPSGKPYVDHINTDRLDNRVDNLRWVTPLENTQNELTRKHFESSCCGSNSPFYGKQYGATPIIGKKDTGESVKFPSIREAGRNGFCARYIQRCLKEPWLKHKGFSWEYDMSQS